MNKKMLPCPFCPDGVGTLWSIDQCKSVYAVCQKCGARTVDYKHAEEAIAAWNRRTQPENEPHNNEPLTLDELRQMIGDVVWCEDTDGINPVLLCLRNHLLKDGNGVYTWALDHEGDAGVYDAEYMMNYGARFYRTKPEGRKQNARKTETLATLPWA